MRGGSGLGGGLNVFFRFHFRNACVHKWRVERTRIYGTHAQARPEFSVVEIQTNDQCDSADDASPGLARLGRHGDGPGDDDHLGRGNGKRHEGLQVMPRGAVVTMVAASIRDALVAAARAVLKNTGEAAAPRHP